MPCRSTLCMTIEDLYFARGALCLPRRPVSLGLGRESLREKAPDRARGHDDVFEPKLLADVLELDVLDLRDHPLEAERATHQAGQNVRLVVARERKQHVRVLGVGLPQHRRLAPVAVQEAAIDLLRERIDALFVLLDDDDLFPALADQLRRHHGQRTGPDEHRSHKDWSLFPIQVPGYSTTSSATTSSRPSSISSSSTALSSGSSCGPVRPVDSPTVDVAETTSNRDSIGAWPRARKANHDSSTTQQYSAINSSARTRSASSIRFPSSIGSMTAWLVAPVRRSATRATLSSTSTRSSLTPPAVDPTQPPTIMATTSTSSVASPNAASGDSLNPVVVCAEMPRTAARRSASGRESPSLNTMSAVNMATTSVNASARARTSGLRQIARGAARHAR